MQVILEEVEVDQESDKLLPLPDFFKSVNLDRKKSISLIETPQQNRNFLCVPPDIENLNYVQKEFQLKSVPPCLTTYQFYKLQSLESLNQKSLESLKRIVSTTSLQIPENISFANIKVQVYKVRWLMLILSMVLIATSYLQWIQYSIVANIMMKYYHVSSTMIDWTSMVFMITYILLVFPISYLMDYKGLRLTSIVGSVLLAAGSWLKVFSLEPDLFLIAFIGQTLVAISQVFSISIPSRLANVWFASEQKSLICGFGVFAAQFGTCLGFVLTPWLVRNEENSSEIRNDLQILSYGNAGLATVLTLLVTAMFQSEPEHPPSHYQAIQRKNVQSNKGYWQRIPKLMKSQNYVILVIAYGINVGVFNALLTLLNQIVLSYFPDSEQDAGNIGVAIIVTGLLGSIIFGYIMDTMHKYKETAVWVYFLTAFSVLLFALALLSRSKKLLYVASIVMGFFMTGIQPIGFEFASELTFPEADGPVAGILNISTQIFGIIITLAVSKLQDLCGDFMGNICFMVLLIFGAVIMVYVKAELKRSSAYKNIATAVTELGEIERQFEREVNERTPFLRIGKV